MSLYSVLDSDIVGVSVNSNEKMSELHSQQIQLCIKSMGVFPLPGIPTKLKKSQGLIHINSIGKLFFVDVCQVRCHVKVALFQLFDTCSKWTHPPANGCFVNLDKKCHLCREAKKLTVMPVLLTASTPCACFRPSKKPRLETSPAHRARCLIFLKDVLVYQVSGVQEEISPRW